MQFLLTTNIFIKRRLGGFSGYMKKQTKPPINTMRALWHQGQGLSPGWMAAASWQVACIQGLAQTMENP